LLYWLGSAQSDVEPAAAEQHLAAAYPLFEAEGDAAGMYLTIAGVIQVSWMTQQNHHALDLWLQRFDRLYARQPDISPPETEARVVAAVLMGIYFRQPDHPQGRRLLERARQLWNQPLDAKLRWLLGSAIGFYLSGSGDLIRWSKTVRLYEPPQNDGQRFLPEQLHLLLSIAFIDCFAGSYASSREYVRQGLLLANDNGVHLYDLFLLAVGVYDGLMQGKLAEADPCLDTMRSILATQPPNFHTVHYRLLLNWRALVLGKFADAVDHAQIALELALANGAVYPVARCRHGLALALFAFGEQQTALELLGQARIPWGNSSHQQLAYDCGLAEAWFRLRMGDEDAATALLNSALTQGKAQGWGLPLWSFPDWTATLLAFALEQGIETAHVQQLIHQAELLPREPASIPPNWPMPVRIQTLGRFVVNVDGEALAEETRSKNRPLELLQTLIAFGGRDVADTRLMDTLWPDASGDGGARSLNTTLHRLRKILGTDHAILLKDRTISLDARYIWLDTWAFERTLEQLRQQLNNPRPNALAIRRQWATLSSLYAGPFLGKGAQKSWALDMAERLRSRMIRFTLEVGAYWEKDSDGEQAILVYRKGLETDPLIESFYQGLMRSYERLGRPAEALASYERCRDILGKGLGIMPGNETVKLYKEIRARAATAS
jgi:DNA-binding SARP family transcriptional activator